MGAIYIDDPADRPYGPTNPDYEYDGKVAQDMETAHLMETLTLANQAARIHIKLGREQFCEEVRRIIGTASARKPLDTVVQELIELCNREVRP